MSNLHLLVLDRADPDSIVRAATAYPGAEWRVLPVDTCAPVIEARCGDALRHLGRWAFVDAAALAAPAHEAVRTFTVEVLARLHETVVNGVSLARQLTSGQESWWWYLEISERSSFRGPLIGQLYRLALIRGALDQQQYERIIVDTRDPGLNELVKRDDAKRVVVQSSNAQAAPRKWSASRFVASYWMRAVVTAIRFVAIRAIARRMAPRELASRGARAFFSFYPGPWWFHPYDANGSNRFFSVLPGRSDYYLAWLYSPLECWRRRREVAGAFVAHRIVPIQAFSDVRDAWTSLSPARFVAARRVALGVDSLRSPFRGFNVGALLADAIRQALAGPEFSEDVLMARGVAKALSALEPSVLAYRTEFQPTENALLNGARGLAATAGFVHFPYGRYFLPMQFPTGADASGRPFADAYLTCGETGARHLREAGLPLRPVRTCGPQRYRGLQEYLRTRPSRAELRRRLGLSMDAVAVFVPTSTVEEDNDALLTAVTVACDNMPTARIVVKPHPNVPAGDAAIRSALSRCGANRMSLLPARTPVYDVLASADVIVCLGSTMMFEAIALGVMPVSFENPGRFTPSSMQEFAEGMFVVRSINALREAMMEIVAGTPRTAAMQAKWPALLYAALGDVTRPLECQLDEALSHRPENNQYDHVIYRTVSN